MTRGRTAYARVLAPIAVAVVAAALLIVIATSIGGNGGDGGSNSDDGRGGKDGRQGAAKTERTKKKVYVVESGDTLVEISRETGVSVERLTRLNPELDPQTLISGQQVRLRR